MYRHPYFDKGTEPGGGTEPPKVTTEQAIEVLTGNDKYVLMTVAEFKDKEHKFRKDEAINTVGKTHGIYDKLFTDVSGLERDADGKESTVDFGKRVIKSLEEKAQGEPNERIAALQTSLEDTKQKYSELQTNVADLETDYNKKLLLRDIDSDYQNGLIGVLPKLGYDTDNEKKLALAGFKSEFFTNYKIEVNTEGKRQVIDISTGKPAVDSKTLDLKSTSEVVQEFAQTMLKFSNGASGGGAGTKAPSSKGMPGITTIEELDTLLIEKHGGAGSKEWADERTKLRAELAI